jgi:hypothetical protein
VWRGDVRAGKAPVRFRARASGARSIVFLAAALLAAGQGRAASNTHQSVPPLAGTYVSLAEHPRVFTTLAELEGLAKRINSPDSYSGQRFGQLATQAAGDLAANKIWDATYSGCNIETYLYVFSFEPQDPGHAATIHSDLHLDPSARPPAGAAVVAARLALYAALVKAGAAMPANAPSPDRAVELSKRILLAWAERGFRDEKGAFLRSASQFCLGDGAIDPVSMTQVGLQVARGVVYSVQAQDFLLYLGAVDDEEARPLNTFHAAMYELIRNALNYRFVDHLDLDCNHYSNHVGAQLTGLLAAARLLDDRSKFEAVLDGGNPSISVTLPWTAYFDRAIYGNDASPNACYNNTGPDGLVSRPFFQTSAIAPGEIDDRYRNSNPSHGIGYPMFTLEWLYDMAEILRIAGYDAYGYRGAHGQSIEMATQYYACYARNAGFGKLVTSDNGRACPNFSQYVGKAVNGVDGNVLIGAYRFPADIEITDLEPSARTSALSGAFATDAVRFGRWRD